MEFHRRFQGFLQRVKVYKTSIHLGAYGAASHKPTVLYSSRAFVQELSEQKLDTTKHFKHQHEMTKKHAKRFRSRPACCG